MPVSLTMKNVPPSCLSLLGCYTASSLAGAGAAAGAAAAGCERPALINWCSYVHVLCTMRPMSGLLPYMAGGRVVS